MRMLVVCVLLAVAHAAVAVTWDANAILTKHNYERKAWGLTSMLSYGALGTRRPDAEE